MKKRYVRIVSMLMAVAIAFQSFLIPAGTLAFAESGAASPSPQAESYVNGYITDTKETASRPAPAADVTVTEDASGKTLTSGTNSLLIATSGAVSINTLSDWMILSVYSHFHDTGDLTVTVSSNITLSSDYCGLGSIEHPFRGTVTTIYDVSITTSTGVVFTLNGCSALFNVLSSRATVNKINIYTNSSSGGLANTMIYEDGTQGTLEYIFLSGSVSGTTINDANVTNNYSESAGLIFGKVILSANATLDLGENKITVRSASISVTANGGSAGGLIGEIECSNPASGKTLTLTGVSALSANVTSVSGNAGGIVGNISNGVTFILDTAGLTVSGSVTAQRYINGGSDEGGCAGGFVGYVDNCGGITLSSPLTINSMSVGSGRYTGGFAGFIEDTAITGKVNIIGTKESLINVEGGIACGGFAGKYSSSTEMSLDNIEIRFTAVKPTADKTTALLVSLDGLNLSLAGGLIGYVSVSSTLTINSTVEVYSTTGNMTGGDRTYIGMGGVAGAYKASALSDSLVIKCNSEVAFSNTESYYYGGAIGYVGKDSYCSVEGTSTTQVVMKTKETSGDRIVNYYGGIIAYVSDGAVAAIGYVTVEGCFSAKPESDENSGSGGFVGYTGNGSVLRLIGTTTLGADAYASTQTSSSTSFSARYVGQIVGKQGFSLIYAAYGWNLVRNNTERMNGATVISTKTDDIGNTGEVIKGTAASDITFNTDHTVTINNKLSATGDITLSSVSDFAKLAITLQTHGYFNGTDATITGYSITDLLSKKITLDADIPLTGTGIRSLTRNDNTTDAYKGEFNGADHKITLASGETYGEGKFGKGEIISQQYNGLFAAIGGSAKFSNLTIEGIINCCDGNSFNGSRISGTFSNDVPTYVGGISGYASGTPEFTSVTTTVEISEKNAHTKPGTYYGYFGGLIGYFCGTTLKTDACIISPKITKSGMQNDDSSYYNKYYSGGAIAYISNASELTFTDSTIKTRIVYSTATERINDAFVGGLVAWIAKKSGKTAVNINGLTVTDVSDGVSAEINIPYTKYSCGGLLGHTWENVEVIINKGDNTSANSINGVVAAGSVDSTSRFGGLFYKVSGKLELSETQITGTYSGNNSEYNGLIVYNGEDLYMVVDAATFSIGSDIVRDNSCDDLVGKNITAFGTSGGILTIETTGSPDIGEVDATVFPSENHRGNTETRYYYNVERLDIDNIDTDNLTATSSLLLWQICNYANTIPLEYFTTETVSESFTAPANSNIDLTGVCFYPTTLGSTVLDFNGSTVNFGETDAYRGYSQLASVQSGFIYNSTGNVELKNVTLKGIINKYNGTSGALIVGTMNASENQDLKTLTVDTVTFNGLSVQGGSTTPLLVNSIRGDITANIEHISASGYTPGTAVASSLFGVVGYRTTNVLTPKRLNFTFSDIKLPGKEVETIFSDALFIKTYFVATDGSSTIVYNFTSDDVNVTYGKELGNETTEYYDNTDKVSDNGTKDFTTGYIKYVVSETDYLWINKKNAGLTEGCGTVGDPYIIRDAQQLIMLSLAINGTLTGTGSPEAQFPNSLTNPVCTGSAHSEYTFDGTQWNKVSGGGAATISKADAAKWFAKAYYHIILSDTITLDTTFIGLGNETIPFIGSVTQIDTSGTSVIEIANKDSSFGFILASKGCYLQDLKLKYSNIAITSTDEAYFGGLIGNVMGGDSIIVNSSVDYSDSTITVGTSTANTQYRKFYLGGFVGIVQAGGVVFKNCSDDKNGFLEKDVVVYINNTTSTTVKPNCEATSVKDNVPSFNPLYINPVIGRVLDGYAFCEGGTALNNTDKNYKINSLTVPTADADKISKTGSVVGIDSAQKLLVFSAALNCGALYGSNSYISTATRSWNTDGTVCTTNYLKDKFFASGFACSTGGYSINITVDCNMSAYGNGFRGLGGKYVTLANNNTAFATTATNKYNILTHESINGNSKTVTVDINVFQYESEKTEYKATSVGFINYLNIGGACTIQNLTLSGTVLFSTIGFDNKKQDTNYGAYFSGYTGGVIGATHSDANKTLTLNSVKAYRLNVLGNNFTGGLVGYSRCDTVFKNCTYDTLTLRGRNGVGGLVGACHNSGEVELRIVYDESALTCNNLNLQLFDDLKDYIIVSQKGSTGYDFPVSTLSDQTKCTDEGYGGLVGWSGRWLNIPDTNKVVTLKDNTISLSSAGNNFTPAGGAIGHITGAKKSIISNIKVVGGSVGYTTDVNGSAGGILGGVFRGTATSYDQITEITGCSVEGTAINGTYSSGGIVGYSNTRYTGTSLPGTITITNCSVSGTDNANKISITSKQFAGGIIGRSQNTLTGTKPTCELQNVTVNYASVTTDNASGIISAGGVIGYTNIDIKITKTDAKNIVSNSTITANNSKGETYAGGIVGICESPSFNVQDASLDTVIMKAKYVGAFAKVNSSSTVNIKDFKVKSCTYNPSLWGGSILGNVTSSSNVNGTGIIVTGSTATGLNYGTVAGKVDNGCKVCIMGIHADTLGSETSSVGTGAANCAIVYANYGATDGTSPSEVPENPTYEWATGSFWKGDGTKTDLGMSGDDRTDDFTAVIPALLGGGGENDCFSDFTKADIPILKITGNDPDEQISKYLDMLTLGGFSSFRTNFNTELTITPKKFSVSSGSVIEQTVNPSIAVDADKNFVTTAYSDKLTDDGGDFSVVTVSFKSQAAQDTDYSMTIDILVYYTKPLKYDTVISYAIGEEYKSIVGADQIFYINDGGNCTFLISYEYDKGQEQLWQSKEWNIAKKVNFTAELPVGTRLLLIDMNKKDGDYKTYPVYYYDVTVKTASVQFSDFRTSENGSFTCENLDAMQQMSDGKNKYGLEQYILGVFFPFTNVEGNTVINYYVTSTVDGNDETAENNGVDVIPGENQDNQQFNVWPNVYGTDKSLTQSDGGVTKTTPKELTSEVTLEYPDYYNISQYAMFRYNFSCLLPAGTKISYGDETITLTASTSHIDIPYGDANIIEGMVNNISVTLNQSISLDFSFAEMSAWEDAHDVVATSLLYLSSDPDNFSVANPINIGTVTLTCANEQTVLLHVVTDYASQLNLGINRNPAASSDTTNNGIIDTHVYIDLSDSDETTKNAILGISIDNITFDMNKKVSNAYTSLVSAENYTCRIMNVGGGEATSGTLLSIYANAAEDYISIPVQVEVYSENFDYSNYKIDYKLTVSGTEYTDFFIFTVTYIDILYPQ